MDGISVTAFTGSFLTLKKLFRHVSGSCERLVGSEGTLLVAHDARRGVSACKFLAALARDSVPRTLHSIGGCVERARPARGARGPAALPPRGSGRARAVQQASRRLIVTAET